MMVTVHQPEHLPWLGFFDKARQVDVLVLQDDVQFRKCYFQNRNRILAGQSPSWLTVPVLMSGRSTQLIRDVIIDHHDRRWRARCLRHLTTSYQTAAFWPAHTPFFQEMYSRSWERLVELNAWAIDYLLKAFDIRVEVIRSSVVGAPGGRTERLVEICRRLRADCYLSGISGREYLDLDQFAAAGITVKFQEFHHPVYRQFREPFVPYLSSLDLLLHHGPESQAILADPGVPRLEEVLQ